MRSASNMSRAGGGGAEAVEMMASMIAIPFLLGEVARGALQKVGQRV